MRPHWSRTEPLLSDDKQGREGSVTYDVVIVGAGPAGITTAVELEQAGLGVALVESGGFDFDPDVQALYDGEVTGLEDLDLTAIRLRMFGGTSNHWGGHCMPLDAIDFARAPLSGLSGWPFGRETLLPFYERAHAYCDLGRFDYALEAGDGIGADDLLLAEDARLETSVLRQSTPTNFGDKYRPILEASPNVTLHLHRSAVDLVVDPEGRVTGVELHGLGGETERLSGRIVVLATGAVETARLMMVSNARSGRRLGDAGGLLGRCYMDHLAGGAAFLNFSSPAPLKAYWNRDVTDADGVHLHYVWRLSDTVLQEQNLVNVQFFLVPFSDDVAARQRARDAQLSVNGLKSVAKWALGRDRDEIRLSDAYCDFITNADSFVAETWKAATVGETTDRVLLRYELEQLPTRDNRVSLLEETDAIGLPKASLHWSPTVEARDSLVRSAVLIGQICGETGLGRIEIEDHFDTRYWDASTAWHQIGTARMAVSPNDGVTDPDCRVHGTRNLFLAGGAVMPSGGRANPTLTIVALAIRLADHLKSEIRAL